MDVPRKARRRREIFWDFSCKIIDFYKKIDENPVPNPQKFLGAEGAEVLKSKLRQGVRFMFFFGKKGKPIRCPEVMIIDLWHVGSSEMQVRGQGDLSQP